MRSSINVKYDFNDPNIIADYLATQTHANILQGVLEGIINQKTRAHLAFGPYGSGKSYVSSILTGILTKSYVSETVKKLARKYKNINSRISDLITLSLDIKEKYITIIFNGYEGDFDDLFAKKLAHELRKNNLLKYMPSFYNSVKTTVMTWKKEFKSTYAIFLEELKKIGISEKFFYSQLEEQNEEYINWFQVIFRKLSAGQEFSITHRKNIIEVIEETVSNLSKHGYGLFLIYDEFGRFLQQTDPSDVNNLMQKFQDIAEFANISTHNFSCLFITHKPISNYFSFLESNQRGEFSKVEQRFKSYEIKSDNATFIDIISKYLKDNRKYTLPQIEENIFNDTTRYGLFANTYSDNYVGNNIIKGLYPLHPMTTFLLPKLSAIFGQNERTLFTFFSDKGQFGLDKYLDSDVGYFYPDKLVDYFFDDSNGQQLENVKNFSIYSAKVNKSRTLITEDNQKIAERILKLLFVWELIPAKGQVKMNSSFLDYSIGAEQGKLNEALQELKKSKLIRYNEIEEQLEIFNGSQVDLEKEFANRKHGKIRDKQKLLSIFNKLNPYKYICSDEYNSKHDITRYAKLFFVADETYVEKFEYADEYIPIYLNKHRSDSTIYGNMNIDKKNLYDLLVRYCTIEDILLDKEFVIQYENIISELDYEKKIIELKLQKFYDALFTSTTFFKNQKTVNVNSLNALSIILSDHFQSVFTEYSEIANDQINMFTVSKVQISSLKKVVEKVLSLEIINGYFDEDNQPSRLIYHSVIWEYERNNKLIVLEKAVNDYIEKNNKGELIDLVILLTSRPFGLRPYVALVILFYILRYKWKDIILSKKDSYIANYKIDDLIDDLMAEYENKFLRPREISNGTDAPSYYRVTYTYSSFDNTNRNFLEIIKDSFKEFQTVTDKSLSIVVCSSLYNWYISLPVIVQQGIELGLSEKKFLDILKNTRIDPILSLMMIIEMFGNANEVVNMKISVEAAFKSYLQKFEKNILQDLGITDKGLWISNLSEIDIKENKVAQIIKNGDSLVTSYASAIENIDLSKWTRSSFESLRRVIKEDYVKSSSMTFNYKNIVIDGRELAIKDIELSTKGKITFENTVNLLEATSKYLTQSEIEKIALMLLERYVK